MHLFSINGSICWLAAILLPVVSSAESPVMLKDWSLQQLEERLEAIDTELDQLAQPSLRGGVGAIGFRSKNHKTDDRTDWVEIDLGQDYELDEIVLVPILWRNSERGFEADAFPKSFRILARAAGSPEETLLVEYQSTDHLLPRIAPLVIPVKETVIASKIRIEATRLAPRAFDQAFIFQLAEVMVFSGETNVALRRPISVLSRPSEGLPRAWNSQFLTDGDLPYLMDSAQGEKSIAYILPRSKGHSLTIDLGTSLPVSGIRLHAVEQSDTSPQAHRGDFGIPQNLMIEGANQSDFSDAVKIIEAHFSNTGETGPIMMWNTPETHCRYVRIVKSKPFTRGSQTGFAEIEILSEGKNVALGKPTLGVKKRSHNNRSVQALTDGNNLYGRILPVRTWMKQLARRHDLETERPQILEALSQGYARQKSNLRRMYWIATLLGAGIMITLLIERSKRQRAITKARERIAANLHDELGANLHAIGILGDLAKDEADASEHLIEIVEKIRSLTTRTSAAARQCTNMLEAKGICEDLVKEMKRTSSRLLADTKHDIAFQGEEFIGLLSPRKRIDLLLFYKESLTNIVRHASATLVRTRLIATQKELQLSIEDNGHGMSTQPPASLIRRARFLGASVQSSNAELGGTKISLNLKLRRGRFLQ